jgi:hypothetical protein
LVEADQSQARELIDSGAWVGVIKCGGSVVWVGEVGEIVEEARKRTRRWPRATAMSNLNAHVDVSGVSMIIVLKVKIWVISRKIWANRI